MDDTRPKRLLAARIADARSHCRYPDRLARGGTGKGECVNRVIQGRAFRLQAPRFTTVAAVSRCAAWSTVPSACASSADQQRFCRFEVEQRGLSRVRGAPLARPGSSPSAKRVPGSEGYGVLVSTSPAPCDGPPPRSASARMITSIAHRHPPPDQARESRAGENVVEKSPKTARAAAWPAVSCRLRGSSAITGSVSSNS